MSDFFHLQRCDAASRSIEKTTVGSSSAAVASWIRGCWSWLEGRRRGLIARSVQRRLRIAETVGLGEKRFVSIIEVDGEQFLLGGTSSQVVLLAALDRKADVASTTPSTPCFREAMSRADASLPSTVDVSGEAAHP